MNNKEKQAFKEKQIKKYLSLVKNHTENEIAELLNIKNRTVRKYAQQTNVKPKPNKYENKPLSDWFNLFNKTFSNELSVSNIVRDKNGKVFGDVTCNHCKKQWSARLHDKIKNKTMCNYCDKGNYGNKYTHEEVLSLLNNQYKDHWQWIKYGKYSKKDSIIKCTLCGFKQKVNLSDMINTTSKRCTNCQTGSFGEYVIKHVLRYNNIPYVSEVNVVVNNKTYRLDFLIQEKIAVEYSGLQHFEKGRYYNEDINNGVKVKAKWAVRNKYEFHEIVAKKTMDEIINALADVIQQPLQKPTPEFFTKSNNAIDDVLAYMKTHSARQTSKDLDIPISRIKKYIQIAGYSSISAWQAENKIDKL